jgi:plasmid replication initiation protein
MELVSIEENKNNLVNKHQELVRNARYRLGDTAIKTLSLLISMIKMSDDEFTQYVIKLSDFKELTGASGNEVFKYVDRMTNELMGNPFWVGKVKLNWVSMAEYREGDNMVVFEIHRYLKPYLLELQSNFLQYNIQNILLLKSGYVIRLYELCKDHLAEGTRYKSVKSVSFDLNIDRLRELFEIPDSYRYNDIKKHILDKSMEQFKEKTDIKITYKEQKIGRKVDRLIITVSDNNKGSNDYTKHRNAFISHMREKYVNKDILESKDKNTGKSMIISVAPDGKLYDKKGSEFDSSRSNEIWDTLFALAQEDKLTCIKQGTLFD